MADNVAVTAGAGTSIAADDIGSVFYQRVKLSLGADGSAVDAVAGAGAVSTAVQRVTLASDDPAVTSLAFLDDYGNGEYETVAASQTAQVLGATGATGDFLIGLWIVPATVSPGAVQIKDGADAAITVFAGGTNSVQTLHGFEFPMGLRSRTGAWQVTTGANVSVIAKGNFT